MKSKRELHRNPGSELRSRIMLRMLVAAVLTGALELVLIIAFSALRWSLSDGDGRMAALRRLLEADALMMVLTVITSVALYGLIFSMLNRKSVHSLSLISAAMHNISEGDLNTEVPVIGEDEVAQMAENLNRMEQELRLLMDREREAERTKNELITNVAHDLRTPLTSIIGYLDILTGSSGLSEETRKHYTEIAYSKSKRLQQLIEDLFSFTKLGGGKVAMHVGKVDVVRLLNQLVEEFYPNFLAAGLSYEMVSNVPGKVIEADGNLLARLFDNLINNAIKYGAEGKKVRVKVHAEPDFVQIQVQNYGYVIPKEELPQIFERFYRVEHSRTSQTGGTGLGLAIVRNIVDMHGGTIGVTSDLNGTIFTVMLHTRLAGQGSGTAEDETA